MTGEPIDFVSKQRAFLEKKKAADTAKAIARLSEAIAKSDERIRNRKPEEWIADFHSFAEQIAKRDRRGHVCEHVTLRPQWLPCPHPDCTTGSGRYFRFMSYKTTFPELSWRAMSGADLASIDCNTETWERTKLSPAPGEEFWAWRKR